MKKISFELANGYVRGWHEVTEQMPPVFECIWEFNDIEGGKTGFDGQPYILTAEEQLQHFNDNYLNYTFRDGRLLFDESHNGLEKEKQRQSNLMRIAEIKNWFDWYDKQVSQASRAQRTGAEWYAKDGEKEYRSLAELDAVADEKQNEIRRLTGGKENHDEYKI